MERSTIRNMKMLGLGAVFSLGLMIAGAEPAEAKPPAHAKAWGYRAKRQSGVHYAPRYNYYPTYSTRYRDVDYDGVPDYRDRYVRRRSYSTWGSPWPTRRDWDRDGRVNSRDRDLDNDGIRNRRDRDRDGDGIGNRRDRHPRKAWRR